MDDIRMPSRHREILGIIQDHQGRAQAIPYKAIAKMVGLHPRRVRTYVAELIYQFRQPIGTNYDADGGGYYWIVSAWELDEVYNKLRKHGISILQRAADVRNISLAEVLGQVSMEAVKS
jgi:hypothetical protein